MLYLINGSLATVIDINNNSKSSFKLDNELIKKIANDNNGYIFYITQNNKSLGRKNVDEKLYKFLTENYDNDELENLGLIEKKDTATKNHFISVIEDENLFKTINNNKKLKVINFVDLIETVNKTKEIKSYNLYSEWNKQSLINIFKFYDMYIGFNIYYDIEENEIKVLNIDIFDNIEEVNNYIFTNFNNILSLEEYIPVLITNIPNELNADIYNLFKREEVLSQVEAEINKKKNKWINSNEFIFSVSIELNINNIKYIKPRYIVPNKFILSENKKTTLKLLILGSIAAVAFGGYYYINNILISDLEEEQQSQLDDIKTKYNNLKAKYDRLEAKILPYNILKKEYPREKLILLIPYLRAYFKHFNLNINKIYFIRSKEEKGKYKIFINVTGFIPNALLENLKNIGLTGFDILPGGNVIQNGFNYIFSFDINKFNKVINKYHLIY